MINLQEREDGVLLPVKARAGGSKNAITGVHNGSLKVMVTQAPEKGKANQAIEKLLAKSLGLQKTQIALTAGQTSAQKTFLITGETLAHLRESIESVISHD